MAGTHVAVHGLGYVGTVTAACLARNGYRVTGVDVKPGKVAQINDGESPVEEPGLDELVADGVETRRLSATTDTTEAVTDADVSYVCVGTPVDSDGVVDTSSVEGVAEAIGEGLQADGGDHHTVVLRSTVPPGTTRAVTERLVEVSGRTPGEGFGVVMNPEFVREGSAIDDFHDPPFVVLGSEHDEAVARTLDIYETLGVTPSEIFPVEPEEAEIVKYACNAFHAAKVAFANEIGRISKQYGVDGRTVMEVFCHDRKLNLSPYYLEPGFAFGGSCLTKDTRALAGFADGEAPLLEAILPANRAHVEQATRTVKSFGPGTVGIAGLAFKSGTDDMRSSPAVYLARALLDEGYAVVGYDEYVRPQNLVGANQAFVETALPELDSLLLEDREAFLDAADVVVVGNDDPVYREVARRADRVFDPVGSLKEERDEGERYDSLCW